MFNCRHMTVSRRQALGDKTRETSGLSTHWALKRPQVRVLLRPLASPVTMLRFHDLSLFFCEMGIRRALTSQGTARL